jgi:phage shock protein C
VADRLYRSRQDRVIAGVAGGVAESLDLDPSIVRVVWVIVAFLSGGLAALVYLVMAIVVPEASTDTGPGRSGGPDPWASPAATGASPAAGFAPSSNAGAPDGLSPAPPPSPPPAGSWLGPDGQPVPHAANGPGGRSDRGRDDARSGGVVFGVILILIGGFFLIRQVFPAVDLGVLWPAVAVALGILLVVYGVIPRRD